MTAVVSIMKKSDIYNSDRYGSNISIRRDDCNKSKNTNSSDDRNSTSDSDSSNTSDGKGEAAEAVTVQYIMEHNNKSSISGGRNINNGSSNST